MRRINHYVFIRDGALTGGSSQYLCLGFTSRGVPASPNERCPGFVLKYDCVTVDNQSKAALSTSAAYGRFPQTASVFSTQP